MANKDTIQSIQLKLITTETMLMEAIKLLFEARTIIDNEVSQD